MFAHNSEEDVGLFVTLYFAMRQEANEVIVNLKFGVIFEMFVNFEKYFADLGNEGGTFRVCKEQGVTYV